MTTKLSFSSQEKLDVINEGMRHSPNVTEICRRHGMGTYLFYYWKRLEKPFQFLPKTPIAAMGRK